MNKPICILLCILLISLSVIPVFAETYNFTSVSDFCTTVNAITGQDSNKPVFISSLSSPYDTAYQECISYYEIDTDQILVSVLSYYSAQQYNCRIYTCSDMNLYSYTTQINNANYSPYIYCYFLPGLSIHRYDCAVNTSGTVTYRTDSVTTTSSSAYTLAARSNSISAFQGFYPNRINYSVTTSSGNYYILDTTSGGSGEGGDTPSYTFESITMDKPPTAYTALSQAFYSAAAARLHDEFPTEYQNIPADKILVDDHNLAALFEAITANTGVFESYAVHSYDFYDNVSYNLAEGMNAIQGAISNMQDIADNIELLASVYASEQEIEAREFAAENQQAIVDEFIDPDSDGAVDPGSFSDLSALSSGYQANMTTDASPSSIWDIFNSNHFGWFSQETANQLDTTSNNRKGSFFETPLLDQQLEEIYNSLGVNNND